MLLKQNKLNQWLHRTMFQLQLKPCIWKLEVIWVTFRKTGVDANDFQHSSESVTVNFSLFEHFKSYLFRSSCFQERISCCHLLDYDQIHFSSTTVSVIITDKFCENSFIHPSHFLGCVMCLLVHVVIHIWPCG